MPYLFRCNKGEFSVSPCRVCGFFSTQQVYSFNFDVSFGYWTCRFFDLNVVRLTLSPLPTTLVLPIRIAISNAICTSYTIAISIVLQPKPDDWTRFRVELVDGPLHTCQMISLPITKSDRRMYANVLPCKQNKPGLGI